LRRRRALPAAELTSPSKLDSKARRFRRLRWVVAIAALATACSFTGSPGSGGDGDGDGDGDGEVDGGRSTPVRAAHVPVSAERYGTGDLVLGSGTIDTTALTISGGLPEGVQLEAWGQELFDAEVPDGLREIAVLHVADFTVPASSIVRVVGDRPLIVLAGGVADVQGVIDGSADGDNPGPGGHGSGPGGGDNGGSSFFDDRDGGGGGGGFGLAGAEGGDVNCTGTCAPGNGGSPGDAYGDTAQTYLFGGSGGGSGGGCDGDDGAGGGAIQISARDSIAVSGVIHVGGGGGEAGDSGCFGESNGGGSGGGSGGAIFLEAPEILLTGTLAANGGGGGAGNPGDPGADATADLTAALGGQAAADVSRSGGAGATGSAPAVQGDGWPDDGLGNAGGAGGGVGRITALTPSFAAPTAVSTPAVVHVVP
jgi:hypothetical protein